MRKIKIYFAYKHIIEPWGGANNFIRTLHNKMQDSGQFEFAEDIDAEYDILFLNQLGMGPANGSKRLSIRNIKKIIKSNRIKKVVVRAVNLLQHSYKESFFVKLKDIPVIKLVNMADIVIFQSNYQKSFFENYGYDGKNDIVIHNGADNSVFNMTGRTIWNPNKTCKIVSSSMSIQPYKKQNLIAKLSECKDVEVQHIGNWPENVDKKNVKILGVLKREEAANVLKQSHIFFHPGIKDSCPNVLFEAICCGLPVIYNNEVGSSSEIIRENGLPLSENNLEETIAHIRRDYFKLKENIEKNWNYYSADRATEEYIKVFNKILN